MKNASAITYIFGGISMGLFLKKKILLNIYNFDIFLLFLIQLMIMFMTDVDGLFFLKRTYFW